MDCTGPHQYWCECVHDRGQFNTKHPVILKYEAEGTLMLGLLFEGNN